jgi:hypothetical protein
MRSGRVDALARLAILAGAALTALGLYDVCRAGPGPGPTCYFYTNCAGGTQPPGFTCINANPPNLMVTTANNGTQQKYVAANTLCGIQQFQGQNTGSDCGGTTAQFDPTNCP